jgi:hypothetical protein
MFLEISSIARSAPGGNESLCSRIQIKSTGSRLRALSSPIAPAEPDISGQNQGPLKNRSLNHSHLQSRAIIVCPDSAAANRSVILRPIGQFVRYCALLCAKTLWASRPCNRGTLSNHRRPPHPLSSFPLHREKAGMRDAVARHPRSLSGLQPVRKALANPHLTDRLHPVPKAATKLSLPGAQSEPRHWETSASPTHKTLSF